MKLSKQKAKLHNEAVSLLQKNKLSFYEKLFVYENWQESAENINSTAGAFFTPVGLAKDFSLEIYEGGKIVDLCAGIGMLSFFAYHWKECKEITCIELNPQYYEVGKKLLPEANWINGSIMDSEIIKSLPKFDQAISNPPFGKIKTGVDKDLLNYKGSEFEYMTIEIASLLATHGTFILPQESTPFKYSGQRSMEKKEPSEKLKKFQKETGFEMDFNVGIDTGVYLNEWKGVAPMCEIVNFEFENYRKSEPEIIQEQSTQLTMF